MRAGVRPYVTAGVALVGAGAIAVTPISPPPAEVPVAHAAVQLVAVPSPLSLYPEVVLRSMANAGALLQQYFADPFPIIGATLENQAAAFADAVTALQLGHVDEFFAAAADIVLEPVKSAGAAFFHLGAILSQPFAVEGFFITAISPVLSGLVATGQAIAEVFDAITSLDLVGAVNAVINIPARIIDGVLNGVPGASFGIFADLPGLLSPADPESDLPPGPIAVGIGLDQDMGAAIPPRESSGAIAEVPDLDAATFALNADVAPVADPEPDVAATDAPEADPSETDLSETAPSANDAVIDDDGDESELPSENSTKNRGPESADQTTESDTEVGGDEGGDAAEDTGSGDDGAESGEDAA